MIRPHNVPDHATGRDFKSKNRKGEYWVWKARKTYYWEAKGNNGEEETFDDACEAARRWIRGDK